MPKTFLRISGFSLAFLLLLSGCSMQKRQHLPGVHFTWSGNGSKAYTQKRKPHLTSQTRDLKSLNKVSFVVKEDAYALSSSKNASLMQARTYQVAKVKINNSQNTSSLLSGDERPPKPPRKKVKRHMVYIISGALCIGLAGLFYGLFFFTSAAAALAIGLTLVILGAVRSPKRSVKGKLANDPNLKEPEYSTGEGILLFTWVGVGVLLAGILALIVVGLLVDIITGFN